MSRRPVPPLVAILLFSWSLSAGRPLWGAEVVEIKIQHVQKLITAIGDVGGVSTGRGLDTSPTFKARKNSEVRISIVDPNPLLFDYTLKKGEAKQTANAKALGTFADSLDTLVSTLGSINTSAKSASSSLVKSMAAAPAPRTTNCDAPIAQLLETGKAINSATNARSPITTKSLTDHAGAKADVAAWQLDTWDRMLQQEDDSLSALNFMLLGNRGNSAEEQCRGIVALAQAEVPRLRNTLNSLKEFKSLVDQIDIPISLEPYTVNINEDQEIKLTIKPSANFPANLSKTTVDTTFTVSPFSRVAITAGAAAVYSFVRSPTFSAVSSGGQFVIKQARNDYNKLDGVVAMQIEPDAWDLGPLNVGIQLGVSPKTDVGLFLGVSLRATTVSRFFTLGVGVAFQRVDQLAPGLTQGQTIATQDLLKTEKTFRSGLYLNLTVTTQKRP